MLYQQSLTPRPTDKPTNQTIQPTPEQKQWHQPRPPACSDSARFPPPPLLSLSPARILTAVAMRKLTAKIFNTTFNPTGIRTGNKILRQRLKGPALAEYYPPRKVTIKDMRKLWPDMDFIDEDEEQRVANVERFAFPLWYCGIVVMVVNGGGGM